MDASRLMKIGFSFGRCVRDIVEGKVNIDDVIVIICRTRMEKRELVEWVIDDYFDNSGVLKGLNKEECLETAYALWNSSRLFQPRLDGGVFLRVPEKYVWMNVIPNRDDPVLNSLLNNYLMAVKLMDDTSDQPERKFITIMN